MNNTPAANKFGSFLKELRARNRITLRQFSLQAEVDPGNISRIERGLLAPPQSREILERYATALGLQVGEDDWHNFFDYAAAAHGIVPPDLMEDKTLVSFLPAFFRTLRNKKPTDDEMQKIITLIQNN